MMVKSEDRPEDRAPGLSAAVLSVLLGFGALFVFCATIGLVLGMLATKTFWGPSVHGTCVLAMFLIIAVGAMWGSFGVKPTRLKAALLSALLGIVALIGFAQVAGVVEVLLVTKTFWGPWHWQIPCLLAMDLFLGIGALWGLSRLKRWKGSKGPAEPLSPATRRTNRLFGLSALVGVCSFMALILGAHGKDPFSNSPLPSGVAIFAITTLLLSIAISWWWYLSSDEHERRANDFGFLVAGGLFMAVTPTWWIAARAGVLPQPNAMILWMLFGATMSIGWFWHRYR